MLRTHADPVSLWEAVLPEEVHRPPLEPERVDRLFDDDASFDPFVPLRFGRPSTPLATYLRLRIAATGQRIQAAGRAVRMTLRDRSPGRREPSPRHRGQAADAVRARPRRGPGGRQAHHRGNGRPGREGRHGCGEGAGQRLAGNTSCGPRPDGVARCDRDKDVPQDGEMAHRVRGPDQHPSTFSASCVDGLHDR